MFKNLKTWFVLSLLVFNFSPAHLDESPSNSSDSDNSSGGSSGSEEPCAKEAGNKKNEAGDMMICQESNPTTTCTCELVQGFQVFLSLLNPCQQALLQQWLAQVQQQVLVMTSWTVNQRFVQFQQSLQLFGQQFPDIWQIISYQTIRTYGRNTFKVKDCQDVAMSFIDEVSASFGNLDQNNNCALFQGLNAVASQCGASTTVAGSTASGTPTGTTGTPTGSTGTPTGSSGSTASGSTATPTGSSGSTVSGSTGTPSGSTGTGLPAACAGYYTSAGTTVGGSTGTATTGTATGSTGTATGSTGTATTGTATGSTGTATTGTATGSTGTATTGTATGSTGTVTGSTGTATTGTVTGSTGTAPTNCSDLSNQITILIGQLTIIFQNTGYTYQQQMVQVYLKFQAFFAQFPQYQQIILSGSISGSFSISIQTFFSLTLSYQQASTISTVFTGDVSVCPVMVALEGACQQSICPATAAGSTATGSTATASGSTATGSTATGSTATGSTATGSTATGSTATASGSTGSTASSGTTPSGSSGSTASSGTTPSGNGSCIPLQFQQELLAFYDELKTIFNSNSDLVYRQKMFAKLYYHYCNDLPGIDQFLDSISCGNGFTFQQIIYVSAIISFPQISVTNIDQLINATGIGWNATGFVAAGQFWQANANVTFNFQGLGFGATQWVVYRNVYINNNISLIIVDTSLTTRQKHVKICGVLQKFISTYSQQQFFWCMPFIGGIFNGTMADYFQANKVANPGCNIPHGCFHQRNQVVNIKSDGTTDFTNAWNNMVSAQTAANQASLASFTAQVNSTVYGATGSGGKWAQIYQLTLIITQAKAAVPSISSSIDSTLVGKWGHFKKFCDCQTSAGNLQNYPGK